MIKIKTSFILLLLFHFLKVEAQDDNYKFKKITTKDGLANSTVNCVIQDPYGYMWFGTNDGLSRYDGSICTNFFYNEDISTSLPNNQIKCFYIDKNKNFWIGTSRGFALYNRTYNNFQRFFVRTNDSIVNNINNEYNIILSIFTDSQNNIYLGTVSGAYIFDKKNEQFQLKKYTEYILITSFAEDSKGRLLIAGSEGLMINNGNNKKPIHLHSRNNPQFYNHVINTLYKTNNNKILIGCQKGLYYLSDNDSIYAYPNFPQFYEVSDIAEDEKNKMWISTFSGVFKQDDIITRFTKIDENNENPYGLSSSKVNKIFIDNGKLLWLATIKGVNIFDSQFQRFNNLYSTEKDKHINEFIQYTSNDLKISNEIIKKKYDITNIYPGKLRLYVKNDSTFYLVKQNTFYEYYPKQKKFVLVDLPCNNKENFKYIFSPGKNGINYMLYDSALFTINQSNKIQKIFQYSKKNESNFSFLFIDSKDNIWMCYETSKNTLLKHNKDFTQTQYFSVDKKSPDSLIFNKIGSMAEDKNGNIWISSRGHGFAKYLEKENKFVWNNPTSLQGKKVDISMINRIFIDSKNRIWLATKESGLLRYIEETNQYEIYGMSEGLPVKNVIGVVEDDEENLWLILSRGLAKFNISTKRFQAFNTLDGLYVENYNINGILMTPQGYIYANGKEGIDYFDPKQIIPNKYAPIVDIKQLYINYKEVDINSGSILSKHISMTDTLNLSYNENVIAFELVALHYSNPMKNQYAYKLEGFDTEWIFQDYTRRFASYSNLAAGQYIFKVKAANSDGVWSKKEKQIVIIIRPPYWETWWFRTIAIFSMFALVYFFLKWRINIVENEKKRIQKQNDILAQKNVIISEQNAEIAQQSEEISQTNEELAVKNELVTKTLSNLQVLSDFGQKLTATLNIKAINNMIYDYVSSLMLTDAFGIGLYNTYTQNIHFDNFKEKNKPVTPFVNTLDQHSSLAVFCFTNQKEVFINDFEKEINLYIKGDFPARTSQTPKSLIYLPLKVENRTIGILTVQSYESDAYTTNDYNNLLSLASYLSIAFDNAIVYDIVRQKNEQIEGSIRYAKTIQSTILPEQELIQTFDSFVLFMPRDVVSGDFYWMYQINEKQSIVAVIDCTGHGVPGAFMSLVGFNLLNAIVVESKITNPAQILEELSQRIIVSLRQDISSNHDGMDVIICLIDKTNENQKKITFSAAKRPLLIYRYSEKMINKINGTKRLIGGVGRNKIDFENHVFEMSQNDIIYLTTDGYSDQNNLKKTRMTIEMMINQLLLNADKPMNEQKTELYNHFNEFKQSSNQRDDVTILGIKF